MAEVIEEFPRDTKAQRTYPWDKWTDGKPRRLFRGFDFVVPIAQFRNRMFTVAAKRDLKVKTSIEYEVPREEWPKEVQNAVSGPHTEVLYVQFYNHP